MRRFLRPAANLALGLAALLTSGHYLKAQAAPGRPNDHAAKAVSTSASDSDPSRDEDVISLTPFEVTGKNDNGYAAASSLAGNRLSTDLKDVGSAISVVTAQMLRDLGATSNESLLQYTTNTEVGNIYGNMANSGSGTILDEKNNLLAPNQNTRVRGLASADNTINYFLTDISWDSYNVDRVDFQRGPNAILFGLGSPAGIINAGTKVAAMTNKGSAEVRYSRFGSVRGSLDINRVLIEKQLAIRIDALDDKQKFQQNPAYQNDKRIYGAVRFDPGFLNRGSAHTSFKANFEQGEVRSNRPRAVTPGDGITPWFMTGTSTGYDASGNPFQYNNLNRIGFDARGLLDSNFAGLPTQGQQIQNQNGSGGPGYPPNGTPNPYWQPWLGGQFAASYRGAPMPTFYSGSSSVQNTDVAWEPTTVRGIGPNGAIDRNIRGIPFSRMSSVTLYRDISKKVNLPGAKFGLTRSIQLSDPSIFDFYDNLIDGPNKWEWQNFHRYDASVTQTFFNGDVGFEAVYDKQHFDNGAMNLISFRGVNLYVDVIQTLPDGTTNPNYGRPFIAADGTDGNSGISDRTAGRVTGYVRHDFDNGEHRSLLTRILGKHTLTGLFSEDTRNSSNRNFAHWVADNAYKDFMNGAGSAPSTIDGDVRRAEPTIYLGTTLKNATSASGASIPAPTAKIDVTSGSIRAFDSTWIATNVNPADPWENPLFPVGNNNRTSTQSENPANYRGWTNVPITFTNSEDGNRDQNTTGVSMGKNKVQSEAFNWQGYLWDGSFVGMFGYRKDTAKSWSVTTSTAAGTKDAENHVILDPQIFKFPASPIQVSDHSNSWSGVFHINQLLHQKLPLNVSVFYNRSQNFQPIAGRVGAYGNPLPAPTGRTTDYGMMFSTKDDNYSLKVNVYKTQVQNSGQTSTVNSFYLGQLFTEFQPERNRYTFEVTDPSNPATFHAGTPNQWTYQPFLGQTADQALAQQQKDVAAWDAMVKSLPPAFLAAWQIDTNQTAISQLHQITYTTPSGFNVIESNVSKGLELELYAQPVHGLRLTANASKAQAVRSNVGDATLNDIVVRINNALTTTAAGELRQGPSDSNNTALSRWNSNFWASWLSVKGQENAAVPELRKWRANVVANYDFSHGPLKGFSLGAGLRWQAKVIIGYAPIYTIGDTVTNPFLATSVKNDLTKPYYGPAETNVDLWAGYSYKINRDLNWRTQLNVRNVGKKNAVIPIGTQPDGTVATFRIAPTMLWTLSNTLEF